MTERRTADPEGEAPTGQLVGARLLSPHGRFLAGPVLFACYAYPPNALGYCGPGDPDALFEMTSDGTALEDLSRLAALFRGRGPTWNSSPPATASPSPSTPGLSRPTGPATSW